MKKILLCIFTTATALISLFFTAILLLTAFGKIDVTDFDNSIVKTLCMVLGGVLFILFVVVHILLYKNNDNMKEVLLHYEKGGTVKTNLSVIKKTLQTAIKAVGGVTYRKCAVVSGDYGLRLKVWVSVSGGSMTEKEVRLRACIEEVFQSVFGFKFYAVDLYLKKISVADAVDADKLKAAASIEVPKPEEDTASEQPVEGEFDKEATEAQNADEVADGNVEETADMQAETTEEKEEVSEEKTAEETEKDEAKAE